MMKSNLLARVCVLLWCIALYFGHAAQALETSLHGLETDGDTGDDEILFAAVLHRHGDRSVAMCFPSEMEECERNWPFGLGQLTARGLNETNILGSYLRQRYIDQYELIGNQTDRHGSYSPLDIHVRSTSYDRTLMSVTSVLQGLYPPSTGIEQQSGAPGMTYDYLTATPIFTVPKKQDSMLRSWTNATCPTYRASRKKEKQTNAAAYKRKRDEALPLLEMLEEVSGIENLDLDNLYEVYDVLNAREKHGYEWPPGVNHSVFEKVIELNAWSEFQMFNSAVLRQKASGVLLNELHTRLSAAATGKDQPGFEPSDFPAGGPHDGPNLYVYSAHDTTIIAALYGMRLFKQPQTNPPYASSIAWELVRSKQAKKTQQSVGMRKSFRFSSDLFVRVFYNHGIGTADETGSGVDTLPPFHRNNTITGSIPGCPPGESLCPLEDFLESISQNAITEEEWTKMCNSETTPPSQSPNGNHEISIGKGALAGIVISSVVVGGVMFAVVLWFTRRGRNDPVRHGYQQPYGGP